MPGDVIRRAPRLVADQPAPAHTDPQYVNAAPELRERIGNEVGSEGVKLLKGGGSFWPVRTGNSKRAFNYDLAGFEVAFRNRRSYAKYVEAGYPARRTRGAAARTLRAGAGRLRNAARRARRTYRAPRAPRLPIRETRVSLRNAAVIASRLAAARAAYLGSPCHRLQRATFLAALTVTERLRALRRFNRTPR